MVTRPGLWDDSSRTATCPRLVRVPAIAKTDNTYAASELEVKRNACSRIIETLWKELEHMLVVSSYLQGRRANVGAATDAELFSALSTLGKLDDS